MFLLPGIHQVVEGVFMTCLSCGSVKQAELTAEMVIHFPGHKNLNKPGVWAFPNLLVCLDCGFSQFTTPKTELALLSGFTSAHETSIPASA